MKDRDIESMETIINAKYYAEAGAFVTKDKERLTLKAIRIEPHPDGGAVIVATDGHTLGLFHDASGICSEPVQIDFRKEVAQFCKSGKSKDDAPTFIRLMQINGDVEIVEAMDGADYSEEPIRRIVRFFDLHVAGEFPNWRMVLPASPATSHLDFNPDYLARGASGSKLMPGISVWAEKPDAQAVVRSSREDFVAIVMPMKTSVDAAYPDYVQSLIPKAEAAKE